MKRAIYFIFCVATAMVGRHIHGGWFWTILNFIFAPLSWAKWFICHDVTMSILRATFTWFFA